MKIIVERNQDERQTPIVTIDLKTCYYPYAIRNALELALELDGYDASTIKEVFNRQVFVSLGNSIFIQVHNQIIQSFPRCIRFYGKCSKVFAKNSHRDKIIKRICKFPQSKWHN